MTGGVMDIGSTRQLFPDLSLMESVHRVELTMNPPYQTGEPLIQKDRPWEEGGSTTGISYTNSSVLKEKGRVRVWYDSLGDEFRQIGYAESTDGVHFEKPELGIVEIGGSRANNIVLRGPIGGGAVWVDPHAPASERYRSFRKTRPSGELAMHSSPDGLNWTLTRTVALGECDTQSVAFWDDAYDRYVLYMRKWFRFDDRSQSYRAVRRFESDDLVEWTDERIVLRAEDGDFEGPMPWRRPPLDYYGGAVFKQHGVYFMLAQAYWHWLPRPGEEGDGAPAAIDVRLCASRDGKTFRRLGGRRPFMRLGPAGRFDSKAVWAMPNPVRMGDEQWIYYGGVNKEHGGSIDPATPSGRHEGAISRAVMRLDGFVSADTGGLIGEMLTHPLRFDGGRLELNVDTSGGGWVLVELRDENGRPLEGYSRDDATPLNGNSVRMTASWGDRTDVSALAGRPVRVRFITRDCKLYAFQFTSAGETT